LSSRDDGVKVLRALAKYGEMIMTAYEENKGWLSYTKQDARAIDDMDRLRLVVADHGGDRYRLNTTVVELLDQSLRTSRLKVVNANIGEAIEGILFLAKQYLTAKQSRSRADADGYLNEIESNVIALCDSIVGQAQLIWRQIDTDFGTVSQLSSKIALNKNTLEKVKALIASLELIDTEALYALGSQDKELRLLQVRLPIAIDQGRKNLSDALHRLNKMLFRLGQLESRAKQVDDFVRYCDTESATALPEYSDKTDVPVVFMAVQPLDAFGAPDPLNGMLELDLADLVSGVRRELVEKEAADDIVPISTEAPENALETLVVTPFKDAVRNVFFKSLEESQSISGIDSFEMAPDGISVDIWIYGLIAEYAAMSDSDRSFFKVTFPGKAGEFFNGNYYAQDVVICPR
jgi:hypothetical protein|tara:strand:- start:1109 stop:2323 length:1215 start_codon:yes stop_codon:yes gene_type:complete